LLLAAAVGCSGATTYDGLHPASQVGREVVIHETFKGPGVEADYVTSPGEPVYLNDPFFSYFARPPYGSEVVVRGILRFKSYGHSSEQHPPDYYYIDHGSLEVMPPGGVGP